MDPWQIVALLIGSIVTGVGILYRAVLKGDFVPGSIYRHQVELTANERRRGDKAEARADKAETQAERNTEALREVTATVKLAVQQRERGGAPDG